MGGNEIPNYQEGCYDPPIPTELKELEKSLDENNMTAACLKNSRKATTYIDLLYLSLCTYPSFPVCCEIDGLGKEVQNTRKTYYSLCHEAATIAEELKKEKVKKGDRVALIFLGSSNLFSAFYGCMLMGAIPIVLPPPIKITTDLPMFNALVKALDINYIISHNLYHQHSAIQTVSHRFTTLFKSEAPSWPSHLKWLYIENLFNPSSLFSSSTSSSPSTPTPTSYDQLKEKISSFSKNIKPNDLAFLQLTSGSTNHPKAVMVPHSSFVLSVLKLSMVPSSTNTSMYYYSQQFATPYSYQTFSSLSPSLDPLKEDEGGKTVLAWVPAYHDFYWGLWAATLLFGYTFLIMSPLDFLGRPASWLESCYRYRTRYTGLPNFGLDYIVNKCSENDKKKLKKLVESEKYGPWGTVFFLGGEMTRHETVSRFVSTFPFIPRGQLTNIYGMAECTNFLNAAITTYEHHNVLHLDRDLLYQGVVKEIDESNPAAKTLLAAGRKRWPNCFEDYPYDDFKIVGENGEELDDGEVGEIWMCNWSRGLGYWGWSDEDNIELFHASPPLPPSHSPSSSSSPDSPPSLTKEEIKEYLQMHQMPPSPLYLRTGDQGFIYKDRVFICGRLKALIIVKGHNIEPTDIEPKIWESSPIIRTGRAILLPVPNDDTGTEDLVVVAEVQKGKTFKKGEGEELGEMVADVLRLGFGLECARVEFYPSGKAIEKTTSGKPKRVSMLRKYVQGGFGKAVFIHTPKKLERKEGVSAVEKAKRRKSFGILGSPRRGKKVKKLNSFGSFEEKEKEKGGKKGKKKGGKGKEVEEEKEEGEDVPIGGGGAGLMVGVGGEELDEEDREQVLELFAQFPMLKERWEEGKGEGEGEGEESDPLCACLSGLVVTSLEATELRNVVYDLYNVYVPVMLFQNAMMQEMTIGDFFIKHIKSAAGFTPSGRPSTPLNSPVSSRSSRSSRASPRNSPISSPRSSRSSPRQVSSPRSSQSFSSSSSPSSPLAQSPPSSSPPSPSSSRAHFGPSKDKKKSVNYSSSPLSKNRTDSPSPPPSETSGPFSLSSDNHPPPPPPPSSSPSHGSAPFSLSSPGPQSFDLNDIPVAIAPPSPSSSPSSSPSTPSSIPTPPPPPPSSSRSKKARPTSSLTALPRSATLKKQKSKEMKKIKQK